LKAILEKIPQHRKGLIYISVTAFLWSTSGFFIKYLTISAFQILLYRSAVAAATVYLICVLRRKKLKFEFDRISNLAAIFYAGILFGFVIATKMTTAANAIFLQFTAPIYLVVLEPIFLKNKFEPKNVITIIICIGGMILFFFGRLEIGNIYGNVIAIGSGISFAFFSLILKYKRERFASQNTLNYVITGNALVALIAAIIVFPDFALTINESLILIYMGAIQIGISYMIFNEGIKYVSATESMIIATLEAIFNPIWVFIGIGEVPSVYSILGGAVIFGAILWRNFSKPQKTIIIE
jgi:drug/metabolite transporter (DMT)-like permease